MPNTEIPKTVSDIRELQRQRVCNLKSRIMLMNRLVATVATSTGYHAGMEEKERTKRFAVAGKEIARIKKGEVVEGAESANRHLVRAALHGIDAFDSMVKGYEKAMTSAAKTLPVAAWVGQEDQHGFGIKGLAVLLGESGDLSSYASPGKLWKRMGCAPFQSGGAIKMPSTWKSGKEGKLSADEWSTCGYSPRRRSVAFNIGEPLLKANKGKYRARYDAAKKIASEKHPDWSKGRCHNHAMLLMTKLLLKELWIEWNKEQGGDCGRETDCRRAALQ